MSELFAFEEYVQIFEEYTDNLPQKIKWGEVALNIGVKPSTLSKFRNKFVECNFSTLRKLSHTIFKNKHQENFKKGCLSLKNRNNVKCSLEYLSFNRHLDELSLYIDSIINSNDYSEELKNWAEAYKVIIIHQQDLDIHIFKNALREYTPKYFETKIFYELLQLYYFFRQGEYKSMLANAESLMFSINKIEDKYIKESYESRVNELLAYVYLHNFDDVEKARDFAKKVINSNEMSESFVSGVLYLLGISYLSEDYDTCIRYIRRYREVMEKVGRTDHVNVVDKQDIPFINNMWGVRSSLDKYDIAEVAHFEAKYGDKSRAVEIIEGLGQDENDLTGFKLYYLAIAKNDMSIMLKSLIKFMKSGNKFYAKLPYEYLKEDEVFRSIAEMAIK